MVCQGCAISFYFAALSSWRVAVAVPKFILFRDLYPFTQVRAFLLCVWGFGFGVWGFGFWVLKLGGV